MELQTAIEILEYHQEWRLGKREDMIHEPKKLTEALDIVLSEVKKFRLGAVVSSADVPAVRVRHYNAFTDDLEDGTVIDTTLNTYLVIPDYNLQKTVRWAKVDCDVLR
jgi:hypothetical protein